MAVFTIKSNNCSQEIGDAIGEMIISRLYATSLFTLIERSEIDRVIRRNKITDLNPADITSAVRVGKLLGVDKIIAGSVNRIGAYSLEIVAVDVATGTVEHAISVRSGTEEELDEAIDRAVVSLERHFTKFSNVTGTVDIVLGASQMIPRGGVGKGVASLYGVFLRPFFYAPDYTGDLTVCPSFAYYQAQSPQPYIRSMSAFSFDLLAGYRFRLSKTLMITPMAGFGWFRSTIDKDLNSVKEASGWDFRERSYNNLSLMVFADVSLFIHDRWFLSLSPMVSYLPESANSTVLAGLNLGIRMMF